MLTTVSAKGHISKVQNGGATIRSVRVAQNFGKLFSTKSIHVLWLFNSHFKLFCSICARYIPSIPDYQGAVKRGAELKLKGM